MKERKFTLLEISQLENFAFAMLISALRSNLFHDTKKAKALYEVALQINIIPEASVFDVIGNGILIRHDCVHRNGVKKDGSEFHEITLDGMMELFKAVRIMVDLVERKLADKIATTPADST